MAEKTYLKCSAKLKTFDSGGHVINIGIKADELIAFARKHANQGGYLNIVVAERRSQGQYGDTHSVYLDTYTPRTGSGALTDAGYARRAAPVADDETPF